MDQDKTQHPSPPLIPCIYCNHSNPANHRFCGMCSKALPDLVKQAAKATESTSGPIPGSGIGVAGRTPAQPQSSPPNQPPSARTPSPAARHDNPNRDLSYLLHDDHVPAKTSRVPFVVGGLLLAAVAGFFALRGGSKTAAVDAPAAQPSDAATTANAEPTKTEPAKVEPIKVEPSKVPPAMIEPAKVEPEKAEPSEAARPPAREVRHRSAAPVASAKRAPKPTASRKPSPAKQETAVADDTATAEPGGDCEKQLSKLRQAAARGDAKARAGLGLVYYAGRCVPRDLPTAYRYYALALRTAPDSPQVSAQLEAIWKQMSPAERQLAQKPQ